MCGRHGAKALLEPASPELLKRGNELIKDSIHATSVMAGFRLAMKESIKFIKSEIAVKTATIGRDVAFQIARTTLSSKIFGRESDFFANMAVDAMQMVKETDPETGNCSMGRSSVFRSTARVRIGTRPRASRSKPSSSDGDTVAAE